MSGTKFQDSDPLIRAGQKRSPAHYGLQGESEETERSFESGSSSFRDILKGRERVFQVAVCCLTVCLASLLSGMGLGFSSATILELTNKTITLPSQILTKTEQSLFAAFFPLGAIFGGLFAYPAAEKLGRQPALIIGGIPTISGWLMMTYAWFFGENHQGFLALLLLGRLVTGFATGWSIFCVSVYITEVASATLKGLFGNCNQLFITIGILIAYGLGAIPCPSAESCFHYYYVSLVPAGIVALFEFLMLFTYESPRWLYKKATHEIGINKSNTEKEANQILNILRGPKYDVPKEIRVIKRALQRNYTVLEQFFELKHRSVYVPFILVLFLMFFQQFSGINASIFFAGTIFKTAKVTLPPTIITVIAVGLVQVLATLVSVVLVDWRGRKQLLVVSSIGMCVSSALLGINYVLLDRCCCECFGTVAKCEREPHVNSMNCTLTDRPSFCNNPNVGVLAIVSVIIFIVSFSLAWGPIPWTSMSELVPGRVRTLCGSIASVVNWSFAVIITAAFQSYSDAVTPEIAWWSFSIVMFVSIFFVVIFIPEVKGHQVEEIEDHFENGKIIAVACECSLCKKHPLRQPSEGQH